LIDKLREFSIEHIKFPINDGQTPADMVTFKSLVDDLVTRLHKGQVVVLHCKGGLGRTGLVSACVYQ
jgi:protein-tyrosine phosphatase